MDNPVETHQRVPGGMVNSSLEHRSYPAEPVVARFGRMASSKRRMTCIVINKSPHNFIFVSNAPHSLHRKYLCIDRDTGSLNSLEPVSYYEI